MSRPLVSVVIASWNVGPYIAEALESVLAQTWTHREIILVDDGSTDDTVARIQPFLPHLRFVPRPHLGLAATRNFAVSMARGEYVALLDPDDVWLPEKLAIQLDVAARYPDSGLIACNGEQFDGDRILHPRLLAGGLGDRVERSPTGELSGHFHREFIACTTISCPAQVMIPRRVFEAVGPFADLPAQDFDYYLRIAQRFPVTLHRQVLARWRYRPDSMSGPEPYRNQAWDRMKVEVLERHSPSCSAEEQRLIRRRRAELLGDLSYAAYRRALAGDRDAWRRELHRLFAARPWPPTALAYLLALRTPEPVLQGIRRLLRSVRRLLPATVMLATLSSCAPAAGSLERRALELDRIVLPESKLERIARGFGYAEGPVWMDDHLLFGDLPNNVIRRWDSLAGASVVAQRSGYAGADVPPGRAMGSNGMTLDLRGRLTICEPGNRRIRRRESDGRFTVLAERYRGQRLNSPNDLVYRSDGSLYFTDPPNGLPLEDRDPAKELPFNGVYRLVGGAVRLLDSTLSRPNGIALSPDERYLYVANAESRRRIWVRYELGVDGSPVRRDILLDLSSEAGQPPDGMKVDREGNLYLTGPGGLWIASGDGRVLGVLRFRPEPSNAAWGGHDGRTLYLTAQSELYRIRLGIPGTPPGP